MFRKAPLRERPWYPKHGVQSGATENGNGTWTVTAVRDFTYTQDKRASEVWQQNVTVSPNRIIKTWYLLEPFTEWGAIAHPYFIFEYESGDSVCFTIEGKRLQGDIYSGWKGLTNEYELGYIWMTEKDCLTMPLTHEAKALYLYLLTLSAEESIALCREFLRDTHTLFEKPEFYNTLTNNCTGRFAKTLRRIGRHAPYDIAWYLPGYSDVYLQKLGLIDKNTLLKNPSKDLMKRQDEVWSVIESSGNRSFSKLWAIQDSNL